MRILAITGSSDRPETALLCELKKRGHEVMILGHPSSSHKSALSEAGIEIRDFKARNRFDLKAARILAREVETFQPDIVHAFTGRTLATAVRCKKKLVASGKAPFRLLTYRGTVGHLSYLDPASRNSFLSKDVDAVSCVSDAVRNYLIDKGIPEEQLATIYKGHDPAWYQTEQNIRRQDLGLKEDSFVVMCVANSRPVKGVDILIEAANQLKELPDLNFLIIGEIRDKSILKKIRNPAIRILGFRNDAQALIALCDCLVIPSRGREGLPKALLEALSQKKAVIASRVGGIPEIIKNETDGLLIPPEDSALLARAISYLRHNPEKCREFGLAGYQRLISEFTVDKMTDNTEALYKSVLQRYPGLPLS